MDRSRPLPVERPSQPAELVGDRWALHQSGANLDRRRDEHRDKISELLQGVIVGPTGVHREMQRPVLNHDCERVGEDRPCRRYQPPPLVGGEQQPVKRRAGEYPKQVDGEMPPSRRPDRVTDARDAQPLWNRYRVASGRPYLLRWNEHIQGPNLAAVRVVLGPPHPVRWNRMQEAEPVGFRRAIPVPIETRVIGQYLDARPDDEEHEEHIEEVPHAQPQREAVMNRRRGLGYARVAHDELLKPGGLVQSLADRDPDDQNDEGERYDPQDVDPSLAHADSRNLAPLGRQPGARPNAVARF